MGLGVVSVAHDNTALVRDPLLRLKPDVRVATLGAFSGVTVGGDPHGVISAEASKGIPILCLGTVFFARMVDEVCRETHSKHGLVISNCQSFSVPVQPVVVRHSCSCAFRCQAVHSRVGLLVRLVDLVDRTSA